VEFGSGTDTVQVGRFECRFRKLMIEIADGSIEMYNMRIQFGNGDSFSPLTRRVFEQSTPSRAIALPGVCLIRSVAFTHRSLAARQAARWWRSTAVE
jgi:hypothetical protein